MAFASAIFLNMRYRTNMRSSGPLTCSLPPPHHDPHMLPPVGTTHRATPQYGASTLHERGCQARAAIMKVVRVAAAHLCQPAAGRPAPQLWGSSSGSSPAAPAPPCSPGPHQSLRSPRSPSPPHINIYTLSLLNPHPNRRKKRFLGKLRDDGLCPHPADNKHTSQAVTALHSRRTAGGAAGC